MEIINGTPADDHLHGTEYDDQINGFAGNDMIFAGLGHDTLMGGAGADTFVLDSTSNNIPDLPDYNPNEDSFCYSCLPAQPDLYYNNSKDPGNPPAIIYDSFTGSLFYDVDSTDLTKPVKIATLRTGLNITNAAISIIDVAKPVKIEKLHPGLTITNKLISVIDSTKLGSSLLNDLSVIDSTKLGSFILNDLSVSHITTLGF